MRGAECTGGVGEWGGAVGGEDSWVGFRSGLRRAGEHEVGCVGVKWDARVFWRDE